jgi:hypothetical protein
MILIRSNSQFNNCDGSSADGKIVSISTPSVNTFSQIDKLDITNKSDLKVLKRMSKTIDQGYRGYKNIYLLGSMLELFDSSVLTSKLDMFRSSLEEDKIYTVLLLVKYIDEESGDTGSITEGQSLKICKTSSLNVWSLKITLGLNNLIQRYGIEKGDSEVILLWREWLSFDDFTLTKDKLQSSLNGNLISDVSIAKDFSSISKVILNRLNLDTNSIIKKFQNILINNYGVDITTTLNKSLNSNVRFYKNDGGVYEIISNLNDQNQTINNVNYYDYDEFIQSYSMENILSKDILKISFIDTLLCNNEGKFSFIREFSSQKYYYVDNDISYIENKYVFPNMYVPGLELKLNDKIGVIDLETYGSDYNGLGDHSVLAGGWMVNNTKSSYKELFYIEQNENESDLLIKLFESIFNKNLHKYTFYIHNMSRFDSVFILKVLARCNLYKITPMWKDAKLIKLTIKRGNIFITLLDSYLLLPTSLSKLLLSYNCDILKGCLPYRFINKDNLYYIGDKPDKQYYDNISQMTYDAIPLKDWNLKDQVLNYLDKDVEGLWWVMDISKDKFFKEYNLNITDYITLPSYTLAAFSGNFYKENIGKDIKMVKGHVEKDIRKSYFGGNVGVYLDTDMKGKTLKNLKYYDMNSQYPKAMLNPMPIGNPIFTTQKDLSIFGFVFGLVIPPSEDRLRVPVIQYRDEEGKVSTPRTPFYRWIFTEEIKQAINYGYQFNMECGYKFERGEGIFDSFIHGLYEQKKNGSSDVIKYIHKIMLNAFGGKFGMRNITSNMKIIKKDTFNRYDKNYNVSFFADIDDDLMIIKYSGRVNENLRKYYKETIDNMGESNLFKMRGTFSSIPIAAAMNAYARMSINTMKNLEGNLCLYSDTDSVVLQFSLPDSMVGTELGQYKLEYDIESAIFIRTKLYALISKEGKVIIKSSGVNPNKLSWEDFEKLNKGINVEVMRNSFHLNWNKLTIENINTKLVLQGRKFDNSQNNPVNSESDAAGLSPIFNRSLSSTLSLIPSENRKDAGGERYSHGSTVYNSKLIPNTSELILASKSNEVNNISLNGCGRTNPRIINSSSRQLTTDGGREIRKAKPLSMSGYVDLNTSSYHYNRLIHKMNIHKSNKFYSTIPSHRWGLVLDNSLSNNNITSAKGET